MSGEGDVRAGGTAAVLVTFHVVINMGRSHLMKYATGLTEFRGQSRLDTGARPMTLKNKQTE